MTVLGAVGFIAACGSSNNSSTGGFAPVKAKTGADASVSGNSSGNSSGASGDDNSGNQGNSSGSTPNDDSGSTCNMPCTVDSDCDTACNSQPGANCCGSGTCFASMTGTCDDEGGASDDSGSPSPAPSM